MRALGIAFGVFGFFTGSIFFLLAHGERSKLRYMRKVEYVSISELRDRLEQEIDRKKSEKTSEKDEEADDETILVQFDGVVRSDMPMHTRLHDELVIVCCCSDDV